MHRLPGAGHLGCPGVSDSPLCIQVMVLQGLIHLGRSQVGCPGHCWPCPVCPQCPGQHQEVSAQRCATMFWHHPWWPVAHVHCRIKPDTYQEISSAGLSNLPSHGSGHGSRHALSYHEDQGGSDWCDAEQVWKQPSTSISSPHVLHRQSNANICTE